MDPESSWGQTSALPRDQGLPMAEAGKTYAENLTVGFFLCRYPLDQEITVRQV